MNTQGKVATTAKKALAGVVIMTSLKAINAEIKWVADTGATLQQRTHALACSVLAHVSKHGNINVLTQFLDAVPDMVRKNALQQWFETFGQVSFKAVAAGEKPAWRIDRTKKVRLGDAMDKPFWKFKANEGAPYVPLNIDDYLSKQIKLLEKDAEKTGVDHSALIAAMKGYKGKAGSTFVKDITQGETMN